MAPKKSKIDRLVHAYRPRDGGLVVSDEPTTGKWSRPPKFEQGDAGLVSTVDDYLAFARMVLADGRHRGQTLLTPASVQAMKTDHLTAAQRAGAEEILGRGRDWGYGMSVVLETIRSQPAAGSFGRIGGFGSTWISDPSRDQVSCQHSLQYRHRPTRKLGAECAPSFSTSWCLDPSQLGSSGRRQMPKGNQRCC